MSDDYQTKVEFIRRLIRLTEAGTIHWARGSSDYWFYTELTRFTYAIASEDHDDVPPFRLRVFRDETVIADEWDWEFGALTPLNQELQALYLVAKRQVVGFADPLSGMLLDLDEVEGARRAPEDKASEGDA